MDHYHNETQSCLTQRTWFTKVQALEQFTDLTTMGKGVAYRPTHTEYIPMQHNIMPRPKFRDYDKEDETGADFTYRTKEKHAVDAASTPASTVRPDGF